VRMTINEATRPLFAWLVGELLVRQHGGTNCPQVRLRTKFTLSCRVAWETQKGWGQSRANVGPIGFRVDAAVGTDAVKGPESAGESSPGGFGYWRQKWKGRLVWE
jgi:hypothetical protein